MGTSFESKREPGSLSRDALSSSVGGKGAPPIQLPRVIEGGVWINDSREFGFHISAALATVGGGVHSRVKWCEPHFALL